MQNVDETEEARAQIVRGFIQESDQHDQADKRPVCSAAVWFEPRETRNGQVQARAELTKLIQAHAELTRFCGQTDAGLWHGFDGSGTASNRKSCL